MSPVGSTRGSVKSGRTVKTTQHEIDHDHVGEGSVKSRARGAASVKSHTGSVRSHKYAAPSVRSVVHEEHGGGGHGEIEVVEEEVDEHVSNHWGGEGSVKSHGHPPPSVKSHKSRHTTTEHEEHGSVKAATVKGHTHGPASVRSHAGSEKSHKHVAPLITGHGGIEIVHEEEEEHGHGDAASSKKSHGQAGHSDEGHGHVAASVKSHGHPAHSAEGHGQIEIVKEEMHGHGHGHADIHEHNHGFTSLGAIDDVARVRGRLAEIREHQGGPAVIATKTKKDKANLKGIVTGAGIRTGANGRKQFEKREKAHSKAVREQLPMLSLHRDKFVGHKEPLVPLLVGAGAELQRAHSKKSRIEPQPESSESELEVISHSHQSKASKSAKSHGHYSKASHAGSSHGSSPSHHKPEVSVSHLSHISPTSHSHSSVSSASHPLSHRSSSTPPTSLSSSNHYRAPASKKSGGSTAKPSKAKSAKASTKKHRSTYDSDSDSTIMSLSGQEEHIRRAGYMPGHYRSEKNGGIISVASSHHGAKSERGSRKTGGGGSAHYHAEGSVRAASHKSTVPGYGQSRKGVNGYKEESVDERTSTYAVEVEGEGRGWRDVDERLVAVKHEPGMRTVYAVR